ncbi:MAG: hypothetical protein ACYDAY_03995 [Candidatus Dormibacteria bacterium]
MSHTFPVGPGIRKGRAWALALLAVVATSSGVATGQAASGNGIVTNVDPATGLTGAGLWVNGQPWRAVGYNVWDVAFGTAPAADPEPCVAPHPDLDRYLDDILGQAAAAGATAVRLPWAAFWDTGTAAGADWSRTDKWIFYARKHNVRLIPTLTNPYQMCGIPSMPESWYHCPNGTGPSATTVANACVEPGAPCPPGYTCHPPGYADPTINLSGVSFRDYVLRLVQRYAGRPEIAFWQLVNEADSGGVTVAGLSAFLGDMTDAIQAAESATSPYAVHLVSLGTMGFASQGVGGLGQIPAQIDEVHDWPGVSEGFPAPSALGVNLAMQSASNSWQSLAGSALHNDAWTLEQFSVPAAPGGGWTHACLSLVAPAGYSADYTAYLDTVNLTDAAGAHTYDFEDGTVQGFVSAVAAATLRNTGDESHDGARSLAVDTSGESTIVCTPRLQQISPGSVISLWLRPGFAAPVPPLVNTVATHEQKSATLGRPIFTGEFGASTHVPGMNLSYGCARDASGDHYQYATPQDRANAVAQVISNQLAVENDPGSPSRFRGGSGFLVWDLKNPSDVMVDPNTGAATNDPWVSCVSVVPGDPLAAVVAGWRPPALDNLADYPAPSWEPGSGLAPVGGTSVSWWRAPAVQGTSQVIVEARAAAGGDPVWGARLVARGACGGSGVTDFSGVAHIACNGTPGGGGSVSVFATGNLPGPATPDPARHQVVAQLSTGVVLHGHNLPVTFLVRYLDGTPISGADGVTWSIPECGVSGNIPATTAANPSATVTTSCPTSGWEGAAPITLDLPATAGSDAASFQAEAINFDHLYFDGTGGCVGVSLSAPGTVSAVGWSEYARDDPWWAAGFDPAGYTQGDPHGCAENGGAKVWHATTQVSGLAVLNGQVSGQVTDSAPAQGMTVADIDVSRAAGTRFAVSLTRDDGESALLSHS